MPSLDDEVTYISDLNSNGTLALYSGASWNNDSPATYGGGYTQAIKWFGSPSANTAGTPGGTVSYYFDPTSNWSAVEKQDFSAGLALWSAVANISFVQTGTPAGAGIVITRGSDGKAQTSWSATSGGAGSGGTNGTILLKLTSATISIDTSVAGFGPITSSFSTYGGYSWQVILHEEGHALGLDHAGPYPVTSVSNSATLQYSPYDTRLWTIMSYIDPYDTTASYYSQYPVTGTNWGTSTSNGRTYHNEATTIMAADILAIQRIYGLPTSSPLSGGQIFGFNTNIAGPVRNFYDFTINTNPVVTIWDMGTGNTLDLSGFTSNSSINLNPGTFSSCDGLTNNICIAFNTQIDSWYGGSGSDSVIANNDGDYLNGGGGNDTITGGTGNDTLVGGSGTNTLYGGGGIDTAVYSGNYSAYSVSIDSVSGRDTVVGNGVNDTLFNIRNLQFADKFVPTVQNLILIGTAGDDTLTGGEGDDILRGNGGTNKLDGGAGTDTVALALSPGNYFVARNNDGTYYVQGPGETDTLISIEQASFDRTSQILSLNDFITQSFNPLSYIASYSDLIRGAGDNPNVGLQHYMTAGYYEGRGVSFNALEYVASNPDLIRGAGTNQSAATEHYILHGFYEGRAAASFDAMEYVASNTDLIPGAGTNQTIALTHYILHGYQEGRATTSFNTLEYVASNTDLIPGAGTNQSVAAGHYVLHGFYEGRATASFNALEYVASNTDLIPGAGTNQTVALTHYILHGYQEGRATTAFDPLQYIASYDDLIRGAGTNQAVGLNHYILHGFYEGRTASFDPVAYLLSNTALQNGQYDAQSAELQFVQTGFYQGKSRSGAFGSEQTQHALTLGSPTAGSLTSGDEDWFSLNLTAGHTYDLSLSGAASSPLADPFLELHDAHGVLVTQDNDSGPGADALIHFSATTTGTYYLVAASNIPGATGNYNILAANG